jgi:glycosyltransferase involved in cell wall biosynthesis
MVEAMAAGAPVISSRCGSLPEVVGDAGVLLDAEEAGEVVAAIRVLSTDIAARDVPRGNGAWRTTGGPLRRALRRGARRALGIDLLRWACRSAANGQFSL